MYRIKGADGFTLIELLVVVAAVGIISTVVLVALNPVEQLRRARDTNRISDMQAMNSALALSQLDHLPLGNASSVYISIPDTSPTCANLGLPPLTQGMNYACQSPQTYRHNDGTGWLPVDLTRVSGGPPLGALPADPVNATSTGLYYVYTTDGQNYKLTAMFEAERSAKTMGADGGIDPALYEMGSNLALPNPGRGLVAYWPLNECSGTTASDYSGNGNTMTLASGDALPLWTPGTVGACALSFDGTNYAQSATQVTSTGYMSFVAWVNASSTQLTSYSFPFVGNEDKIIYNATGAQGTFGFIYSAVANTGASPQYQAKTWHMLAGVQSSTTVSLYADGALVSQATANGGGGAGYHANPYTLGALYSPPGPANFFFVGTTDDARVYNRALSPGEILEMYNAEK